MKDIYFDYQETLLDLIMDALERNDLDVLMGIQTFDAAISFSGSMSIESIIAFLFVNGVNAPAEAKQIREELAGSEGENLYIMGMYDSRKQEAERLENRLVPYSNIISASKGLRNAVKDLSILQELGIIKVERDEQTGEIYVGLSEMWDGILDDIARTGREAGVYGSAMGRILSIAIHKKGFTSLIPLIHAYLLAIKNGKITNQDFLEKCCPRIHRPYRFFMNLIDRNWTKVDDIKVFKFWDGQRIILNPSGIRAVKVWRTLANARSMTRTYGELNE